MEILRKSRILSLVFKEFWCRHRAEQQVALMERGQRGSNKKASKEIKEKTDVVAIPEFGSREVIAFENKEQYLFLLEFFIHHMTSERLAKLNQMFFVPTTISVEFLNFTGREGIEINKFD